MDRRQLIKASIAGIGALSGALALGCAPGAPAGPSTPEGPASSAGTAATTLGLGSAGSASASSQATPSATPETRAPATPTVNLNSGFAMPVLGIGISNYYTPAELDAVLAYAEIQPAIIQNENHPYNQNAELAAYAGEACGAFVESWYPLSGRGNTDVLFGNDTIAGIAAAHEVSPAQAILRWHVQAGYIAIPGSSNPNHIAENIAIFDFELTDDEMAALAALDRQHRFERW